MIAGDFVRDRREERARRFACQVLDLVKHYLSDHCRRDAYDTLLMASLHHNLTVVEVPPECDHLDKLALERKMLEVSMGRVQVLKEDSGET